MARYKRFDYKITSEIVLEDSPKIAHSYIIYTREQEEDEAIESAFWYETKEIAEKEARAHIDKFCEYFLNLGEGSDATKNTQKL